MLRDEDSSSEVVAYPRPQVKLGWGARFNLRRALNVRRPTFGELAVCLLGALALWEIISPQLTGFVWNAGAEGAHKILAGPDWVRLALDHLIGLFFALAFFNFGGCMLAKQTPEMNLRPYVRSVLSAAMLSASMVALWLLGAIYLLLYVYSDSGVSVWPLAALFLVPLTLVQTFGGLIPILTRREGLSITEASRRANKLSSGLRLQIFLTYALSNCFWALGFFLTILPLAPILPALYLAIGSFIAIQRTERIYAAFNLENAEQPEASRESLGESNVLSTGAATLTQEHVRQSKA